MVNGKNERKESGLVALTIVTRETIHGKDELTGMELITPQGRYMIRHGRLLGISSGEGYDMIKHFHSMLKAYAEDIVSGKDEHSLIIEAHKQ